MAFAISCPQYTRFYISGVNLGLYNFQINPSTYDPFPARTTQSYKTIVNSDPTVDDDNQKKEIKLNWSYMPEDMWIALEPYCRRNVDGTSESIYFFDGNILGFNGSLVHVSRLESKVIAGYESIDKKDVSLILRQIF